ncbi:MAG: protein-glutamate O-methyltransferase CheR [Chitinivibrionales bacterium]|nr:protein-glutamate O-methyltransferase CheR [Chitinivibrionales bacterium]
MNQLSDTEFKQLRNYIEKNCGIALGDEKAYLVENRLAGLLAQTNSASFDELLRKAVGQPELGLRDKIVDAMTTNETSWFRDQYPYEILDTTIFKQFSRELAAGRCKKVRIWCAACSTGQEPYSVALTLREFARKNPGSPLQNAELIATDISPSVLFLAIAGRFDQIAMSRGMPPEIRDRYFTSSGKVWVLNDAVRKMVTFKKLNLQDDFLSLGKFDLVFCRNVMIYFSDTFKRDLFKRIAALTQPGGVLFLGASESAVPYTDQFTMISENRHLYYKLRKEARQ